MVFVHIYFQALYSCPLVSVSATIKLFDCCSSVVCLEARNGLYCLPRCSFSRSVDLPGWRCCVSFVLPFLWGFLCILFLFVYLCYTTFVRVNSSMGMPWHAFKSWLSSFTVLQGLGLRVSALPGKDFHLLSHPTTLVWFLKHRHTLSLAEAGFQLFSLLPKPPQIVPPTGAKCSNTWANGAHSHSVPAMLYIYMPGICACYIHYA